MNTQMEITIVIWWLAGVVGGTAFFVGFVAFFWNLRKKHTNRPIYCFIPIVIGFIGMSNSIFSILRLFRSWLKT
jgi:hypothetical protein